MFSSFLRNLKLKKNNNLRVHKKLKKKVENNEFRRIKKFKSIKKSYFIPKSKITIGEE